VHGLYDIREDRHIHYDFHPGQEEAWESTARFVCILSGTQGGKTTFGPPWLYREIQEKGPGEYLVATPTFPLLYVKALPEFKYLFEKVLQMGRFIQTPIKRFEFSRDGLRRMFGDRYPYNRTTIYFGHAMDPDSLEAATYKAAWLDEAGQKKFKIGSWEAIQRRLSIHQGRVLFTTTPYYLGWLKTEVADRGAFDTDYDVIRFESKLNPSFPPEEWARMQASLPRWKFDLFYRAIWTRPAGLIYDNWNEGDKVKPFKIPDSWRRIVGVDFGGVNTCVLFGALDSEKSQLYVYRIYQPRKKRTSAEHVRKIREGEPEELFAIGGGPSEDQWRMEFKAAGLDVRRPPISDVEVGIDRVYAAHQAGRIKVFSNLAEYFDEKESYSRVLDESGEPTEKIEDKHEFHIMDCERYIWAELGEGRGTGESYVNPAIDPLEGLSWDGEYV
jgi:hypothetical protein